MLIMKFLIIGSVIIVLNFIPIYGNEIDSRTGRYNTTNNDNSVSNYRMNTMEVPFTDYINLNKTEGELVRIRREPTITIIKHRRRLPKRRPKPRRRIKTLKPVYGPPNYSFGKPISFYKPEITYSEISVPSLKSSYDFAEPKQPFSLPSFDFSSDLNIQSIPSAAYGIPPSMSSTNNNIYENSHIDFDLSDSILLDTPSSGFINGGEKNTPNTNYEQREMYSPPQKPAPRPQTVYGAPKEPTQLHQQTPVETVSNFKKRPPPNTYLPPPNTYLPPPNNNDYNNNPEIGDFPENHAYESRPVAQNNNQIFQNQATLNDRFPLAEDNRGVSYKSAKSSYEVPIYDPAPFNTNGNGQENYPPILPNSYNHDFPTVAKSSKKVEVKFARQDQTNNQPQNAGKKETAPAADELEDQYSGSSEEQYYDEIPTTTTRRPKYKRKRARSQTAKRNTSSMGMHQVNHTSPMANDLHNNENNEQRPMSIIRFPTEMKFVHVTTINEPPRTEAIAWEASKPRSNPRNRNGNEPENLQVVSIQKSVSHSFYAGTIPPNTAEKLDNE